MGAYQIWRIEWKDKESKKYFESLKLHSRILCNYNYLNEKDLSKTHRICETTYHMGWNGYGLGFEFLDEHGAQVNIKKFYSLDLTTMGDWYNELNRYVDMEGKE